MVTKTRPLRLLLDRSKNKFYIIVNKKRRYIKTPLKTASDFKRLSIPKVAVYKRKKRVKERKQRKSSIDTAQSRQISSVMKYIREARFRENSDRLKKESDARDRLQLFKNLKLNSDMSNLSESEQSKIIEDKLNKILETRDKKIDDEKIDRLEGQVEGDENMDDLSGELPPAHNDYLIKTPPPTPQLKLPPMPFIESKPPESKMIPLTQDEQEEKQSLSTPLSTPQQQEIPLSTPQSLSTPLSTDEKQQQEIPLSTDEKQQQEIPLSTDEKQQKSSSNLYREIADEVWSGNKSIFNTGLRKSDIASASKAILSSIKTNGIINLLKDAQIDVSGISGDKETVKIGLTKLLLSKMPQLIFIASPYGDLKPKSSDKDDIKRKIRLIKTLKTKIKSIVDKKGLGEDIIDETDETNKGITDHQINHAMRQYPSFVGCIMRDEISDLYDYVKDKSTDRFSFIMNLDDSKGDGTHWVAIYVDLIEGNVEYFDSFGRMPPKGFIQDMSDLIEKLEIKTMLKFKINKIKSQNIKSDLCGYHSMNFIINRTEGLASNFKNATQFDQDTFLRGMGEKKAELAKDKYARWGFL